VAGLERCCSCKDAFEQECEAVKQGRACLVVRERTMKSVKGNGQGPSELQSQWQMTLSSN